MSYPVIRLKKGHDRRLRAGHPWIYSNEIVPPEPPPPPGSLVRVRTAEGKVFGVATYNPHSLIALRVLTRNKDARIGRHFFGVRLERALRLRERLFARPFYRLVHGEADGLPGLVIDRYGEHLVVQLNTAGMERLWPACREALEALLEPASILLRNDSPVRALEGLAEEVRVELGAPPERVRIEENGLPFWAQPRGGQKTGWYYDQRLNRRFVRLLARDQEVLDLYCYGGGFAFNALHAGARTALLVDSSEKALELARANARLQGMEARVTLERAEVFDLIEQLASERRRFGLVMADPPSFVKSKAKLATGLRAYRRLAERCARLVAEGGVLCLSCCSHNVTPEDFRREILRGLKAAGRGSRQLTFAGAAPDHPVHPMLAETAYLKFYAFALD